MGTIYLCSHCRTQNFATRARLRKAQSVPLKCWKCGKEIKEGLAGLGRRKEKRQGGGGRFRREGGE